MTTILFEDKPEQPVSMLLNSNAAGVPCLFAAGGSSVGSKIQEFLDTHDEETLYVFFDVVPGNIDTHNYYRTYRIRFQHCKNVHIFPIPCIEYVVLKMLLTYGYIKITEYNAHIVDRTKAIIRPSSAMHETLENMYKQLLNGKTPRKCFRNKKDDDDAHVGCFYRTDCKGDSFCKFCKLGHTTSLVEKAEQLYTMLPIFDINSNVQATYEEVLRSYGIYIKQTTVDEVYQELQQLYNKLCDDIGVVRYEIINVVPPL